LVPVLPPPPETIRNKRKKKYGRLIDHSMYNIIKIYPGKYGIKSFIFLMDREHYKSLEKIKEYLRTNLHVRIEDVKELGKSAFIITCGFAHHEITIYTAILGKVKCIEEEIAKLIELELNIKCKPEKKEIKKFYEITD